MDFFHILSNYKSQSHDYSLSNHELTSSIFILLLLFFLGLILSVFVISIVFLMVKLHRCNEDEEMAVGLSDYQDCTDDEDSTDEKDTFIGHTLKV
jgi:uncharacterized BrkB/YihY/UPF0761 family membrane protein